MVIRQRGNNPVDKFRINRLKQNITVLLLKLPVKSSIVVPFIGPKTIIKDTTKYFELNLPRIRGTVYPVPFTESSCRALRCGSRNRIYGPIHTPKYGYGTHPYFCFQQILADPIDVGGLNDF